MAKRLEKVRRFLKKKDLHALIISNPFNRRYLSGFDGSSGLLVISSDEALLLTDFRYYEQAAAEAEEFRVHRWQEDLYRSLALLLKEAGWSRVGFEAKHVSYADYEEMRGKLKAELVPVNESIEKLRMFKNSHELTILKRGAEVLDQAFDYACSLIAPGVCEKDVARDLEIFLLRQGAEERSFRFIVASGERGALPHGTASEKAIASGELVTIDFGAIFEGYATDMTRTVACRRISRRQREIYDIVKKAQQEAVIALKPGLQGHEVDAVARKIIADAGYKDYFGHGLGHGVGLETHEQPVLNPRSKTVLKPGMVTTIEPGIYIPGWGGVRIEDMVTLTAAGAERMTRSQRELVII